MEKNLKKDPGINSVDVSTSFIVASVMLFKVYFVYCGCALASLLVLLSPDRAVRAREDCVLG